MLIIREDASLRQNQKNSNIRFDSVCNALPIELNGELHEQHHWCYKNFTNMSRLVDSAGTDVNYEEVNGEYAVNGLKGVSRWCLAVRFSHRIPVYFVTKMPIAPRKGAHL
jgi:hypothetical protein